MAVTLYNFGRHDYAIIGVNQDRVPSPRQLGTHRHRAALCYQVAEGDQKGRMCPSIHMALPS